MGASDKIDSHPNFGTKIRLIRKNKGLTQAYMAEHLNLSTRGYSKIELGETQLGVIRLFEIADILEVSVHEILLPNLEELRAEAYEARNQQQERIKELQQLLEKVFNREN